MSVSGNIVLTNL